MARPRIDDAYEVVNLASESEEEGFSEDELEFFDAQAEHEYHGNEFPDMNMEGILDELNARYNPVYEAADGIIDLTGIPDIDVPPSDPILVASSSEAAGSDNQLVTEAVALQMVLDFLPDISIDHVLNIFREKTTDLTRTNTQCQNIIVQLVENGAYPKEDDDANSKKRKRGDEDDWNDYDKAEPDPEIPTYVSDATDLLKDEFLNVPVRHIVNVLKQHKTLFKAYIVLEEQVRNYGRISTNRFSRIGKARTSRGVELILIERGSQVPKELHAAKKKIENETTKRRKAEEAEQAEAMNLQYAQSNDQMGECACCFDDVPLNRMIFCNGGTTHSYCLECPKRQIETQMGLSNCRPKCFGVDNCEGTFTRKDLQKVLSDKTFERLEHMQQLEDLAAAGLDFLSECPFCDFKMECPPVEVDKEFRCQNKKCAKTSCRLCEKETHIPLTCKEAEKEGQITLRHIVEEAMSAALIRQCNRCKHPFVKDYGCNKMTCSHCRNVQCYVCSKNVTNYEHFGEVQQGRCPLHENVEDRHEQEVKRAADEAMAKVRADNPNLSDADLMIKVSDRVKKAEDARKGQAQARANDFPYHMVDNQLRHRVQPQVVPPLHQPAQINPPVAQYVPLNPYAVAPVPFLVQPLQFVQQPAPQYHNALDPAIQHPQQPAHFAVNFFPLNRMFGGQVQPPIQQIQRQMQQQQQQQMQPHDQQQMQPQNQQQQQGGPLQPRPAHLQAFPPHLGNAAVDANNAYQRLAEYQQARQQRAQRQAQAHLRLLHIQQENMERQRQLRQQEDLRRTDRNARIRELQQMKEANRRAGLRDLQ